MSRLTRWMILGRLSRKIDLNRKFYNIILKSNLFFMFKKEVYRLTLTYRTFVGFLALWAFLIGNFLVLWAFLAPTHMGRDWTKLTILFWNGQYLICKIIDLYDVTQQTWNLGSEHKIYIVTIYILIGTNFVFITNTFQI